MEFSEMWFVIAFVRIFMIVMAITALILNAVNIFLSKLARSIPLIISSLVFSYFICVSLYMVINVEALGSRYIIPIMLAISVVCILGLLIQVGYYKKENILLYVWIVIIFISDALLTYGMTDIWNFLEMFL